MTESLIQERNRLLYDQLSTGSLASVANSAILGIAFWGVASVRLLLGWLSLVVLLNGGRILLAHHFRRTTADQAVVSPRWGQILIGSNFLSGLLWGMGSYALFDPAHMFQTIILIFVLAGMTAGAAPLYAARISAYLMFIAPALLLFAMRLLQEREIIYLLMATMVSVYLLVLWVSGRQIHQQIMQSLQLRNDNLGLVGDLTRANQRIEQANIDLQHKVAATEKAERDARRHRDMLDAIRRAQTGFIEQVPVQPLFAELLEDLIELTGSEYGFVGEVLTDENNQPYLKSYALTDIAWNAQTRAFYDQEAKQGVEFRDLDNLFGYAILHGEPVISNQPAADPRARGLPQGHPPLTSFLGVPFFHGREIVGLMGIANRREGYDQAMVEYLAPFLHTCANIIHAYRVHKRQAAAEQALQQQRRQLQAVLDNAAEGILTLDADNRVSSINRAGREIFDLEDSDIVQVPFHRLLSHDSRESFQRYLRDVGVGGRAAEFIELAGQHSDGTEFPLEIGVTSIDLGGETIRIAVLRDITERKKVERMKNEFIATVSHELRTPLTALQGALGLMRANVTGELPAATVELLDIAESNSDRLLELINDILDIERVETGRVTLDIQSLDLGQELERAVSLNRQLAARQEVILTLQDSQAGCRVLADARRLQQILGNLLSNAIKFSAPGGEVQIAVFPGQYRVRVLVRDEGCGIPDDFKQHVFEKFSQADNTDSRRHAGSGLGLSISKALIEQMDGEIGFVSQQGQGSEFFIDLPRADNASDSAVS